MIKTFVRISNPIGQRLVTIASGFVLDYILNCAPGAIGVLELTVSPIIDPGFLFPDGWVQVLRSIDGGIPYVDNNAVYLIETFKYSSKSTFIRAFHINTIVARRHVLYPSGSTFANKSPTFSDDLVKAYWRENAGSLIGVSREGTQTQANLSSYITTDPDQSLGATVGMQAANDPLNDVLTRICDASNTAGKYLTYEIVCFGERSLFFRTYVTSRGVDRRYGTANPVILEELRGNLENAEYQIDYHNHITAAVALGPAQGTDRLIASTIDTVGIGLGPFHRIESIVNLSNTPSTAILQDNADAIIRNSRPQVSVTGKLIDTNGCTRGIHYDLGDMLSVKSFTGAVIDVRLDLVHEHVDASGNAQGQDLTSHQVAHRYSTGGLKSI